MAKLSKKQLEVLKLIKTHVLVGSKTVDEHVLSKLMVLNLVYMDKQYGVFALTQEGEEVS